MNKLETWNIFTKNPECIVKSDLCGLVMKYYLHICIMFSLTNSFFPINKFVLLIQSLPYICTYCRGGQQ